MSFLLFTKYNTVYPPLGCTHHTPYFIYTPITSIYINDISDAVLYSKTLLFADDTKCFRLIKSFSDQQLLQQDLNSLSNWSTKSNLSFKPSKTVHVSYNSKISTSYSINDSTINLKSHHKDLGIVVSDDLQWHLHHNHILDKSYKILGMIRRAFGKSNSVITKAKLYTSLIRSQLAYCSIIWRPYLIQDIIKLESIQRRATKFIMNDYTSDYKSRLLHLNLLPLMYVFEITDIIFQVKSFKFPSASFNINNYVSFSTSTTTRSSGVKLIHNSSSTNKQRNHYFIRICRLWNAIPIINLNLSVSIIKKHLKVFFWNHKADIMIITAVRLY